MDPRPPPQRRPDPSGPPRAPAAGRVRRAAVPVVSLLNPPPPGKDQASAASSGLPSPIRRFASSTLNSEKAAKPTAAVATWNSQKLAVSQVEYHPPTRPTIRFAAKKAR